jgi:hypothetical protein
MFEGKEMFVCSGVAPDVMYARAASYQGLLSVLGAESPESWELLDATYQPAEVNGEAACNYQIRYVRSLASASLAG